MANTFKNYTSSNVGTSPATVYTVPGATTSVTIGLNISNVTTSQITVDVQAAGVYVVKDAPIPAGSALSVLDGKIILEAADTVVVTSDTATSADVILSVLEQS
jgi:biopolymer transport protein ExbD